MTDGRGEHLWTAPQRSRFGGWWSHDESIGFSGTGSLLAFACARSVVECFEWTLAFSRVTMWPIAAIVVTIGHNVLIAQSNSAALLLLPEVI